MVVSTLVLLLLTYILVSLYSNRTTISLSIKKTKVETNYVASNFSNTYENFLSRIIQKISSTDFKQKINLITTSDMINYVDINNTLQTFLTECVQMNDLTSSVLLEYLNQDSSTLFYSYRYHPINDINSLKKDPKLESGTGITLLSTALENNLEFLPVAIPLNYNKNTDTTFISSNFKETDFIMYAFFDLQKINSFLKLYCNNSFEGTLYLVDKNANNLSLLPSFSNYSITTDTVTKEKIQNAITNNTYYVKLSNDHIYIEPIDKTDLYLVNIVPHALLTAELHTKQSGLIFVGFLSIILITFLSVCIALFVTHPLNLLIEVVQQMKNNTYKQKLNLHTKDELQQLVDATDSMYHTIQQQLITIKAEEHQRHTTYLQMPSEQVNPHFIYNALEFINLEVYMNHPENASKMISNLAKYLRISLAYGENEVQISQELEQVMAYINIINYRFSHSIQITTSIPENISHKKILKCTIQPLVENALKHGFKIGTNTAFPITPVIEIKALLDENYLTITVTDNGVGIDVDRATQIMLTSQNKEENDRHFGLNNIYNRFKYFYGDIMITFSSIPFFENKVTLKVPAKFFL